MELTEFYKNIVESCGLIVKEDGTVNLQLMPDEYVPYTVSDKQLVLPTPEILRNPDWDRMIAFHPLSENIARKDSEIFRALTSLINLSLNVDIGLIVGRMVELCADKDQHKNMNHRQTAFLQLFPNADATSFKNWEKLNKRIGNETDNAFIKLITLRNKDLEGQKYARVTFVKFPYYQALVEMTDKDKDYELNGVKLRKKDALGYRKLLEYVLSGIPDPDKYYSYGTRSLTAPSFHALVSAMVKVREDLSRTFNLLKMDYYDLYWKVELDNLNQFKGVVPSLEGNEGDVTEGEKRKAAMTPQVQSPAQASTPTTIQPQVQPMMNPVIQQPMVTSVPTTPVYPSGNKYVQSTGSNKTVPTVNNTQSVKIPVTPKVNNPTVKPMATIPVAQPNLNPAPQPQYAQPYMQPQIMYQQPQIINVPGQPPKMIDSMGRPVTVPGYQSNLVPAQYGQMQSQMQTYPMGQMMQPGYNAGMQPNMLPAGVPYFPGYPMNNMPVYR